MSRACARTRRSLQPAWLPPRISVRCGRVDSADLAGDRSPSLRAVFAEVPWGDLVLVRQALQTSLSTQVIADHVVPEAKLDETQARKLTRRLGDDYAQVRSRHRFAADAPAHGVTLSINCISCRRSRVCVSGLCRCRRTPQSAASPSHAPPWHRGRITARLSTLGCTRRPKATTTLRRRLVPCHRPITLARRPSRDGGRSHLLRCSLSGPPRWSW